MRSTKILTGRAHQIREFLGRLDTFAGELNAQRDDIVHAIDSTDQATVVRGHQNRHPRSGAHRIPAVGRSFAQQRDLFANTGRSW